MRTLPTIAVIMPMSDDQFWSLSPSVGGIAVIVVEADATAVLTNEGSETCTNDARTEVRAVIFASSRTKPLSHERGLAWKRGACKEVGYCWAWTVSWRVVCVIGVPSANNGCLQRESEATEFCSRGNYASAVRRRGREGME